MQTTRTWPNFTQSFFRLIPAAFLFACLGAMAQEPDDVLGFWLTEEKNAVIEVKKDDDGSYFGEIVWIKDIHTGDATEKLDEKNPDKSLRKRSLLGLKNTWGFSYDDGEWTGGKIYDPKSGKTYSAKMSLAKDGKQLDLRGYVGVPLFGRTSEWQREKGKVPAYMKD